MGLGPVVVRNQVAFYPVLKGLAPGDRIVTAGSFLVDAETRLNPAAGLNITRGQRRWFQERLNGYGRAHRRRRTTPTPKSSPPWPDYLQPTGGIAEAQRFCPVLTTTPLGSMGPPIKLVGRRPSRLHLLRRLQRSRRWRNPWRRWPKWQRPNMQNLFALVAASPTDNAPPPPVAEPSVAAAPKPEGGEEAKIQTTLEKLSPDDRALAVAQKFCVVLTKSRLGSMGVPVKLMLDGKPVFLCRSVPTKAERDPKGSATKAEELRDISAARAKLSDADRKLVEAQSMCVVMENSPLGSMGAR